MKIDIGGVLHHMISEHGFVLPYHKTPKPTPAERHPIFDEISWDNYQWNPPVFYDRAGELLFTEPDPNASPKPTWTTLIATNRDFELSGTRSTLLEDLDEIATRRIALLYHPKADTDPHREWQVRLSGADTSEQDAERLRLVRRHGEIKQRIGNLNDLVKLRTVHRILNSDALWTPGMFPDTFPS